MNVVMIILCIFLIACAITVSFTKNILSSIVVFSAYSLIMSIIWIIMESPDLGITEAAVGAGVTSLLFYATLKKINQIDTMVEFEDKNSEAENGKEKKE